MPRSQARSIWRRRDSLGRLSSSSSPGAGTVGYGYDLAGRLTSITYPNGVGTVTRGFDDAGRMRSVTDWLGRTSSFDYDADANPTADSYGNGTSAVWSVDRANRLTGIAHKKGATSLASFSYQRDGNGQETRVASSGVLADNHSYAYNQLNFLTDVEGPATTRGYDSADNLNRLPDGRVQSFDAANQISSASLPTRFVAKGSAADGLGTRATLTANLTAAASPGDQMIVASTTAEATAVSAPAGWVNVGTYTYSGIKVALFRKTATGGETSVTLSYPGASATSLQPKTMAAVVYADVDPVNPIDTQGSATAAGTSSGPVSVNVGSISPTGANDRLVFIEGAQGLLPPAGTWSSTMAQVVQVDGSPVNVSTGIADETLNSAGPTGPRTATYSGAGASTPAVGILLALRASTTTYGYDLQGNRVSARPQMGTATSYSYDQANRLSSISGSANASYTYRGDGLRATKTVGAATTSFGWDESGGLPLLLTENSAGRQTNYLYGPGGRLIEQIQPRPYVTYLTGATKEDKTPQTCDQLTLERATALDIERLVDRLVADPHRLIIGEVHLESLRDLFRAPGLHPATIGTVRLVLSRPLRPGWAKDSAVRRPDLPREPLLHVDAKPLVLSELCNLRPSSSPLRVPLSKRRLVVEPPSPRRRVPAQLSRDRRRRTADAPSDLVHTMALRPQQLDVLAFCERQVAARPRRRQTWVHAASVTEPSVANGG